MSGQKKGTVLVVMANPRKQETRAMKHKKKSAAKKKVSEKRPAKRRAKAAPFRVAAVHEAAPKRRAKKRRASAPAAAAPKKRGKKRHGATRRNPGTPTPLLRGAKAALQGLMAAGASAGIMHGLQQFPTSSKSAAVATQVAAGIVLGGLLGALGLEGAGAIAAGTFGTNAILTAGSPTAAQTQGAPAPAQVSGMLPDFSQVRGLIGAKEAIRQQQVSGLVQNLRGARG